MKTMGDDKRPRHKGTPTPPRKFTDSFVLGQEVSIIRTEHGWFDGRLVGTITSLGPDHCAVTDEESGLIHTILKPRDIT